MSQAPQPAPQQARAVATRERLLQAAAGLLAEEGLRGTTTTAVALRAGVSQGALFKHFPTKTALLSGATEAVLASLVQDFRRGLPKRLPHSLDARLAAGVSALWKVFRLPAMQGLFEVYLAARTDRELGSALAPLLVAHRANIFVEACKLVPELAGRPDLEGALEVGVDAVVYAMQGVALGLFDSDERREREHLAFFQRLAIQELAAAGASAERPSTASSNDSSSKRTSSNGSSSKRATSNGSSSKRASSNGSSSKRASSNGSSSKRASSNGSSSKRTSSNGSSSKRATRTASKNRRPECRR